MLSDELLLVLKKYCVVKDTNIVVWCFSRYKNMIPFRHIDILLYICNI